MKYIPLPKWLGAVNLNRAPEKQVRVKYCKGWPLIEVHWDPHETHEGKPVMCVRILECVRWAAQE